MNRMWRRKAKRRRALRRLFGDKDIEVELPDGTAAWHRSLWLLVYRLENAR